MIVLDLGIAGQVKQFGGKHEIEEIQQKSGFKRWAAWELGDQ